MSMGSLTACILATKQSWKKSPNSFSNYGSYSFLLWWLLINSARSFTSFFRSFVQCTSPGTTSTVVVEAELDWFQECTPGDLSSRKKGKDRGEEITLLWAADCQLTRQWVISCSHTQYNTIRFLYCAKVILPPSQCFLNTTFACLTVNVWAKFFFRECQFFSQPLVTSQWAN